MQRHINNRIEHLRLSFMRKKFPTIHYFSGSLFTQKLHLRCLTPLWIRIWSCWLFPQRLHLDVWLSSRYTCDMFKERQKLCKTCKWVIFKNVAAETKKWFLRNFWENLHWGMIFFTVIFSKFFLEIQKEPATRGFV